MKTITEQMSTHAMNLNLWTKEIALSHELLAQTFEKYLRATGSDSGHDKADRESALANLLDAARRVILIR